MATINEEVKLYIVQCLACYDSPSIVANSVYEEFGVSMDRSQVQKYDPTKVAGKGMAAKLKAIFETTRTAFLEESIQIPIASKLFRLRSLQRMHDYYVSKKNYVQAQAVLEQAAKEVSGFWSSKQQQGDNAPSALMEFYKQISGSSMPVVQDDEIFEGEVVSFDAPVEKEVVATPAATPGKRAAIERD